MSGFLMTVILVLWGMQAAVGLWLYFAFPVLGWKVPVGVLPAVMTAFTLFGISYTRSHYGSWEQALYLASYTWFGLAFLAFCICAVFALVQWVLFFFHLNMRAWLGPLSVLVMAGVFAVSLWGGLAVPKIKRVSVSVPGAPKMKIALLSDSHLGMGVSVERFDAALKKLEKENPDVLFVLGDVFEYGPDKEKYAARLAQVRPPLGVYGVFGNHEYYTGYQNSLQFYKEAGISLLQNETAVLENGVQVAGVKDIRTARVTKTELQELLAKTEPTKPLIWLSHTPLYAEEASAGRADLMFSGHTHNGQIFPFNALVRLQFPRVYGLYEVEKMKFYITSGMFYWGIPFRFLAPAEIPVIEVN